MKLFHILALSILGSLPFYVQAKIENLRFFGLWLGTYHANILEFDSTLIVPHSSPDTELGTEIQAIWPGVQGIGLLQNVVHTGQKLGEWWQLPFYCCNPPQSLANRTRVYPGDHVTNKFHYDGPAMTWHDSFVVAPAVHNKTAEKTTTQGFDFDQPEHVNDNSTMNDHFTWTFMTIELQGNATWNFGPVEWRNILVRANTTDTDWCTKGPMLNGGAKFNYTFSQPEAAISFGTSSCYIAEMIFHSP